MAEQHRIGARMAAVRKIRSWGGRELAPAYSLLTKVESGAWVRLPGQFAGQFGDHGWRP
jgi:hypothetical protein